MAQHSTPGGPRRREFKKGETVTIHRRDGAALKGMVAADATRRSYIPVAVARSETYVRWVPPNEVAARGADPGDRTLRAFVYSDACKRALLKRGEPARGDSRPAAKSQPPKSAPPPRGQAGRRATGPSRPPKQTSRRTGR